MRLVLWQIVWACSGNSDLTSIHIPLSRTQTHVQGRLANAVWLCVQARESMEEAFRSKYRRDDEGKLT